MERARRPTSGAMAKLEHIAEDLKFLAEVYGWEFIFHKPEYAELYFYRKGCGLTIWYSKMTVRTALTHPRMGKTQMYRKRVDMELMERILHNPRVHTPKGYIKKQFQNRKNWRPTNASDIVELQRRYKKPNRSQ